MNTIRYVFMNKQPELQSLVVKYGLSPAQNQNDLWKKVNYLLLKFREEFMKDIADIHPDKDLFSWRFSLDKTDDIEPSTIINDSNPTKSELENIAQNIKVEDKTSGCCGEKTSGCCGSGFDAEKSDCNGCNSMNSGFDGGKMGEKIKNNMPLIIIGSLALVFGVIALTNRKLG